MQGNLDNNNAMDKDKDTDNGTVCDEMELFVGIRAGECVDWY